jgi:pimeloyl-ACP methyl ester carboxylesterase
MAPPVVLLPGLLCTARLDPPEVTERRRLQIALAQEGRFGDVADMQFPLLVHRSQLENEGLQTLVRLMADELIPPQRSAEIADAIPGARLVTIVGCGHLSTLERPEQVTAALTDWLRA